MAGKRSNEPKVIISGATGLIGSALSRAVQADGKQVLALSHSNRTRGLSSIHWEPENNQLPREQLDGADAVVHLAGETLVGRWTEGKKRRIRNSRIHGTQLLAEALAARTDKPRVLLCASAVGYYGDRGDEILTEDSPTGDGFLARICQDWEQATVPAREAGIRVVHLRFGVVLSAAGGALKEMSARSGWASAGASATAGSSGAGSPGRTW